METIKQISERRKRLEEFAKNDLATKLIAEANKKISCGPKCAENETKDDLKNKYNSAQKKANEAPRTLFNARRNYYTYAFGKQYYDDYREKSIKKTVEELTGKLKRNHSEFMRVITNNLDSYKVSVTYFKNMVDIFQKYETDNKNMLSKLGSKVNEYNLNARRVDYEEDEIVNMKFYLYVSIIIYFISFAFFIVMFLMMKLYTDPRNMMVFVFAVILPFLIPFSLQYFFKILEYTTKNSTNYNVYLNGSEM